VQQNTLQFVRGLPANNVLLTGARGTGKSSLIKALLNRYASDGLRLIELDKKDLLDLPDVVERLVLQFELEPATAPVGTTRAVLDAPLSPVLEDEDVVARETPPPPVPVVLALLHSLYSNTRTTIDLRPPRAAPAH